LNFFGISKNHQYQDYRSFEEGFGYLKNHDSHQWIPLFRRVFTATLTLIDNLSFNIENEG
jgi:hypothetical protein